MKNRIHVPHRNHRGPTTFIVFSYSIERNVTPRFLLLPCFLSPDFPFFFLCFRAMEKNSIVFRWDPRATMRVLHGSCFLHDRRKECPNSCTLSSLVSIRRFYGKMGGRKSVPLFLCSSPPIYRRSLTDV